MPAIECSITVVVTGSSTASPAMPKKPPTAPVIAVVIVWERRLSGVLHARVPGRQGHPQALLKRFIHRDPDAMLRTLGQQTQQVLERHAHGALQGSWRSCDFRAGRRRSAEAARSCGVNTGGGGGVIVML